MCSSAGEAYYKAPPRNFLLCPGCRLVYQNEGFLTAREEKKRYELHNNDPGNKGYANWLQSFIRQAVLPWYNGGDILDFGSGPNPVLTRMLQGKGYSVYLFDPIFSPAFPGGKQFSMIILHEVLEHVKDPVKDLKKLHNSAAKDALLVVKTLFFNNPGQDAFKSWWYKEDSSHIRFYNARALETLGTRSGWLLVWEDGQSLAVFKNKQQGYEEK